MTPFVHLHVHSYYSVLDGQPSLEALVRKARYDGMPGIALTDHGAMYGIKSFVDLCNKENKGINDEMKEVKKELEALPEDATEQRAELTKKYDELAKSRFKPIIGCEVYCARRSRHLKDKEVPDPYHPNKSIDASGWHLILLAKNFQGYQNLIKMVSLSYTEGEYYRPRIDKELLEKYHEGIIACSACLGGEVPQHIMAGHPEKAEETARWFQSIFGDDYYLEVQLHQTDKPFANTETYAKQLVVNKAIYELGEKLGIKVVATNDVHFVNEEDADLHERLICISTKKDLHDPSSMSYSKQEWLKTTAEMNEIFADHPEALANTLEVLNKVEFYSIDHSPIMPNFDLPEGFTEAGDYLRHLTYEGAKERYGADFESNVELKERIDFELNTILSMGFPGYFLIVWDFIRAAREMGVSVGPGRGSAAGSVVAYCLHITDIDPIKYNLLFERFLNPDRISMPDIDVDIEDNGRELVLDYVNKKYGEENVARIITFGYLKAKSAFADMARIEKISIAESRRISKLIPSTLEDDEGNKKNTTLKAALEKVPELKEIYNGSDAHMHDALEYAQRIENTIRNIGMHACGVIISGKPINEVVPLAQIKDPTGKSTIITQYEGKIIEDTGLIKMDFLGLQTLTIIKEALENIKHSRGIEVDIDHIPIDDPKTYELYSKGATVGTFQFESPGMRKHLINLKPSRFEDLIAMNALYRPGPMDNIPDFIDRKHGRAKVEYDLPEMEEVLNETYGITVYQEQVMLLSRLLANFTRGESDNLRKAMGKKNLSLLKKLEGKFFEGGVKNGHDKTKLEKIWNDWVKFASYAFNKSHSACYAWVSYQTAYLKANYPSEYMAGNLSCMLGKAEEVAKLMEECKEMQIKVLPPDVNESMKKFSVDKDGNIRFGLGGIKGVNSSGMDAIIEEREKNGKYTSIYDFVARVPQGNLNRKSLESLTMAGALDCFGLRREEYFAPPQKGTEENFMVALLNYGKKQYDANSGNGQLSLFGDAEEVQITPPKPGVVHSYWSDLEKLNKEKELIGLYLSGNPLDKYKTILQYYCNTQLEDLNGDLKDFNGKKLTLGGMVVNVFQGTTKTNKPYLRVDLEDLSGIREMMFWQEDKEKYERFLTIGNMIFISATVQPRFPNSLDKLELKIQSIENMDTIASSKISTARLVLPIEELSEDLSTDLVEGVKKNQGNTTLEILITDFKSGRSVNMLRKSGKVNIGVWLSKIAELYNLSVTLK